MNIARQCRPIYIWWIQSGPLLLSSPSGFGVRSNLLLGYQYLLYDRMIIVSALSGRQEFINMPLHAWVSVSDVS